MMKRGVIDCIFTSLMGFVVCQGSPREVGQMNQEGKDAYAEERKEMVERQIWGRGVTDKLVLKAMLKVERHRYVPDDLRRYNLINVLNSF